VYRETGNHYRLPGKYVHDLLYPWIADAVREEIRVRKAQGIAKGNPHDTYAQHMVPALWYPAIMQMLGAMKLAYGLTQKKLESGAVPPRKKLPYFRTLLATDIKICGIDITLPQHAGTVTLYEGGDYEMHQQQELFRHNESA